MKCSASDAFWACLLKLKHLRDVSVVHCLRQENVEYKHPGLGLRVRRAHYPGKLSKRIGMTSGAIVPLSSFHL